MKYHQLKNYNYFVNGVWVALVLMFWIQFSAKLGYIEAFILSLFLILLGYPLTTLLSTTLLRKALKRQRFIKFSMQFILISNINATLFYLLFSFFAYLEVKGFFPLSTIFNAGDTTTEDISGSILAGVFFNFGFCGLRFFEENLKLQKILVESKLDALTAQISPHFMFNVLNHIYVLMQKDVESASNLLLNYSDILRYQLYKGKNETVTLHDEVTFLKKYIAIEDIRWNGKVKITTEWNITDKNQMIYPLLFIIFVENAFKHVNRSSTDGSSYVNIQLNQTDKLILLYIKNSVSQNICENDKDSGLGLTNIRQRLDILYPNAYSLEIEQNNKYYSTILKIQQRS